MRRLSSCLLALFLSAGISYAAIDITTCGQTVPPGTLGVVQTDLVCPDTIQTVSLGSGATLDLNGHVLTATGLGNVIDVHSRGGHTVRGPGQLVNITISCGVGFDYARSVSIQDLDIVSTSYGGIDCLDQDAYQDNRLRVRNVNISGSSTFGITGQHVRVSDVSISGADLIALWATTLRGKRLSIVGNAAAAIARDGYARSVSLSESQIEDNGDGIAAVRVLLRDTTVTGNGVPNGFDISSFRPPRLLGTSTCDSSLNVYGQASWGICSND